jgi:ACS family hexuronate transporter-like MFS transporter
LLFLATLINYTDRLALVATQRHVLNEFVGADEQAQNRVWGDINFAFGISYGLFQVLAGFLIDRFRLRLLYVGAIVVWSTAGVLTGFAPAGAIAFLMMCRVMLGLGESYNWPCAVATIRRVIPRESRGLANGIFHSGASIGAVATPLLALLMVGKDGSGWRNLFIMVGAIGFCWVALWLYCTRGERGEAIDAPPRLDPGVAESEQDRRPFVDVFGLRLFWICLLTGICVNVCWHVYYTWFPRYLKNNLGKDPQTEQWIMAGFFIAADLGSMLSGWTIRRLTRTGFRVERARQLVMIGLACLTMLSVPAVLLSGSPLSLPLFYIVAAAAMGGFAIFFSLAQDIVARHTALLVGTCGAISWVVIACFNKAMGDIVGSQLSGKVLITYGTMFMIIGAAPALAAIVGLGWRGRA